MKMNPLKPSTPTLCLLGLASVLAVPNTTAQETPAAAAPPPPATIGEKADQFFNGKLPDAITKGKFSLNVRLRYEQADNDNTQVGNAFTIRPRFGFTTAPVYGFQGMLEGEHISAIGNPDNYNQAGLNPAAARRGVVADPTTTELNQAWISYSNADWKTSLKGGRQRFVLDNHRFIGDVGWRQNQQTFDAITAQNKSIENVTATYGYIWNVNRIFSDRHVAGDFDSSSHIFHVAYSGWKFGTFTGYGYLLRFDNAPGAAAASAATFGTSFVGGHTFDKDTNTKVNYRAEYARQVDYGTQPIAGGYEADYFNVELGGDYRRVNFGGGYEELGSDGGRIGFSTPLATLHAFNGWADTFLATPAAGLRDVYAWAGVKLPYNIPAKLVWHQYYNDSGGGDLGHEWNAVISRALGKHWTILAKYAHYSGTGALADTQKIWAQLEFNF